MALRLSYFVPPAPLIAARHDAMLDGVELVETRTSGSPQQLEGLRSGTLDVVVTAVDNLFAWTQAGADVRLVAQIETTTPLSIYGAPGVAALRQLAEQPFAVDALSNGFVIVARHLVREAGIAVHWVEVGGVAERFDALLAGDVGATLLGPPFDTRASNAGLTELARVQDVFPNFPGQGVVVRAELAGTPELTDFLDALRPYGLLPVDRAGLDLLSDIRRDLGLLPPGVDLHSLTTQL